LSNYQYSAFVSKWDSNGNYLWAKKFDYDIAGIGLDGIGNVYSTGKFNGTVDFDPGADIVNLTSSGGRDIFINKIDANGNYLWAKQLSGISINQVKGISVDRTGNVYTTGSFYRTADFDPGPNQALLTSTIQSDIFVSKLDSNGDYLWAKQFNAGNLDPANDITVDSIGNVYTTGIFSGTVDFDPGTGVANLAGGIRTSFISKLNSAGNYINVQQLPAGSNQIINVTSDGLGNVYTTGVFFGTVDFDPGITKANLNGSGLEDIFISKSDSQGKHLWVKQFQRQQSGFLRPELTTVDNLGNVYTTGYFSGIVDFDPGPGTALLNRESGGAFISKLDKDGNYLWAKQFGDSIDGIAIDRLGNVHATGSFRGTVDFDPGAGTASLTSLVSDSFIGKLDSDGNYIWAKQFVGTNGFSSPNLINYIERGANNITVDSTGNIYATGIFGSTVDFDPGPGQVLFTSAGEADIFISKLDGNGNYLWAKQFGNSSSDIANGISLDSLGNVYTTGTFEGTEDFDPGSGTASLTSAGYSDIFVSKLDNNGNYIWVKQLGGTQSDSANRIVLDRMDNVYIGASSNGTIDFDPGPSVVSLTAIFNEAGFVTGNPGFVGKLNSNGNYVAAQQLVGRSITGITVDGLGNLYTTAISQRVLLESGQGTSKLSSFEWRNSFIRKWAQTSTPQSDLLLRNPTSGEIRILGLDQTQVKIQSAIQTSDGAVINPSSEWKLVSGKSDLNGDRIQDLIWFNTTTGESAIWYMKQGTTGLNNIIDSASYIYLPNAQNTLRVGLGWQLTSVENLLGDDRPEFLWENRTTGASAIWQLNLAANGRVELNLNTSGFIKFGGNIVETGGQASGWKIAGVGNFDGNTATKDLLWFNETTSEMAVWQLNGTTIAGFGYLNYQGNTLRPGGWKPVAIGNIDGVGTDEIVLQNGTSVATWTLGSNFSVTDKSTILSQKLLTGEQIQGLADLNADGTLDLLARQKGTSSDSTQIYYLNAVTFQLSTPTPTRFITQARTSTPYTTGDRQWNIIDAVDLGGPLTINNL
jgi:hypothetical protein